MRLADALAGHVTARNDLTLPESLKQICSMKCSVCNTGVPLAPNERVGFRDTCGNCHSDLHTCRNCAFYDTTAYNDCREPTAERVSDSERVNHCDWFSPGSEEGGAANDVRTNALSDVDALFKK
jgi:hypothetical protein